MTHKLHTLFWPQSVAVIGASDDETKIRGRLLAYLQNSGYGGRILPINPSRAEIKGLPCFPNVAAVGGPIDVALIAIPAELVPDELERCAAAGVKNAVIITSGFAEEAGEAAEAAQRRIAEISSRSGMRILGPNAEGYFNAIMPVAATFSPVVASGQTAQPELSGKKLGIIAQSGGVGFALYSHGRRVGIGFSYVITSGNEADLTIADFLDYLVEDDATSVILLYLETIRDVTGFCAAAARARAKGKPIIAIKVGQSGAGQRATASHTAAVAGWQAAYAAAFARYGIVAALDLDEAMMMAGLLLTTGRPAGKRVGVVTVSGGAGAWAADALERAGLILPETSEQARSDIARLLPSYGSAINPIDVTAQGARNGGVQAAIQAWSAANEVDSILLALSCAASHVTLDAANLAEVIAAAAKPVVVFSYTTISEAWRAGMIEAHLPITGNLTAAAAAMAGLVAAAPLPAAPALQPVPQATHELLAKSRRVLCEYEVKSLLASAGFAVDQEILAKTADEAVAAAGKLGFPAVLKLQSPKIQHKTEIGGLKLNLKTSEDVRAGYIALAGIGEKHAPGAVDGILVQKMAPSGVEIIIGMVRDASFGALMMVGFGGVAVELYRDVAYAIAPVSVDGARAMLDQLKSAPLLYSYRGRPKLDVDGLANLIAQLSQLAAALPDIVELEVNPVILHADGSGLTLADALATRAAPPQKFVEAA
jgi:acyl-CoA synthetase (NDP forming)